MHTRARNQVKRADLDRCKTTEMMKFINNRGWISVSISDASSSDMPLVFASEGFFKMTGYAAGEILGHSLDMLYGPDTDPATIALIQRAVNASQTVSTCILAYRKDGTSFWNHICLQPVWDSSAALRFYICTQYTGTSGVGNLVRDIGASFPSGLQTHATIAPIVPSKSFI